MIGAILNTLRRVRDYLKHEFSELRHPATKSIRQLFREVVADQDISAETALEDLSYNPRMKALLDVRLKNRIHDLPVDWQSLKIRELEALRARSTTFVYCETNLILRAAAIMAVVSGHVQLLIVPGGAAFLFALTGFNFRRFKFSSFLRDDSPWPSIWRYEKKILIPYFVAVLSYFAWKGVFEADVLLLYSNFLRVHGVAIFPIWFIEVLVQCVLVLGLLFWLRPVRAFAKSNMALFSVLALCFFAALKFALNYAWDTDYLYNRVPHHYMVIVWLGWCAASAASANQKAIITALTAVVAYWYGLSTTSLWIFLGLAAIMWTPLALVPTALSPVLIYTANSSYYIFLTHMASAHILREVLHNDSPAAQFAAGIGGGLLAWVIFDKLRVHRRLFEVRSSALSARR